MFRQLTRWRRKRILRRHPLPLELWTSISKTVGLVQGMHEEDLDTLREWTTLFLHDKHFFGVRGFPVSETMKLQIAVQACVPILNLDPDCYRGWRSIIIYPETFLVPREEIDETGVVHAGRDILAGEAWEGGPVVISWADSAPDAHPHGDGTNVIIHEMAHKLDMRNGTANGLPPLHRGMKMADWTAVFTAAYELTNLRLERDEDPVIDPYAAEDPAEFFAVASEFFFEAPWLLRGEFPAVYRQLSLYYRQDPAARRPDLGMRGS